MASHTARFASVQALWFEKTGDRRARERAFRSFNWATYMCSDEGIVAVGVDVNEGFWFSDGYGDYIRHFFTGMAAVPDWAPSKEPHLLRSTSVMRDVHYVAVGTPPVAGSAIRWSTFDADATERLRVPRLPTSVTVAGKPLVLRINPEAEGYTVLKLDTGGFVLTVHHLAAGPVEVAL